jgi:hypothetical protein
VSAGSVWSTFQQAVHDAAGAADRAAVLAGVTEATARSLGVDAPDVGVLFGACALPAVAALDVPPPLARPDLPGRVLESLLEPGARHRAGAYYTRTGIAEGLVAVALDGGAGRGPAVCDPAVGGGAFLLAAARALRSTGRAPADIVTEHLWGVDIDPLAVATTRAVLALWAATEGCPAVLAGDRLVVGDFLAETVDAWSLPPGGFDAVVGNPPFQGQLGRATARSPDASAAVRAWLGDAVHGYVDTAALFLVASCRRAAPGGRVALVLPESLLASAHAAGARRSVLDAAALRGVWIPGEPMFAANVRVCSPVLEIGAVPTPTVRRWSGAGVEADGELTLAGGPHPWARLMSEASGVPTVDLGPGGPTLVTAASATAGFRQHFYGLAGHVREWDGDGLAPLVTVGAIDPARCRWGAVDVRFAGRPWQRPAIDVDAVALDDPEVAAWIRARLVPKVLVATQTRVVEAVADPEGRWVPSVPVIAVAPTDPARLWHVAAVLLAPPVSVWATERAWGTGLGKGTLRVSAKLVARMPVPPDHDRWDEGATLVRVAHETGARSDLIAAGRVMTEAYGLKPDHPALDWWQTRLPDRDRR